MSVRKLSADAIEDWSPVTDGIQVADVVDTALAPDAEMTVGFARLAQGESLEISFPYDEVLVITKGAYTVRTEDGDELTAAEGEVLYLPAGASNHSAAEADTQMVYVASPPSVYAEHVAAATAAA